MYKIKHKWLINSKHYLVKHVLVQQLFHKTSINV